jgi:hypothetical protein
MNLKEGDIIYVKPDQTYRFIKQLCLDEKLVKTYVFAIEETSTYQGDLFSPLNKDDISSIKWLTKNSVIL